MPSSAVVALRRSHENLAQVVDTLTPNQLRGASYNSEWTIAQTLSHIGSGAEIFSARIENTRSGAASDEHDVSQPIWDAWNARTPEQQAADAVDVDRALIETLEAIGAEEAARLEFAIGPMQFDLAGMAALRVGELAVHVWDVAVMLDPEATVDELAVAEMVDGLGMLASYTGKPTGRITRIRISTTGPDREFVLEATEQVSLQPWTRSEPLRRLIMPAEALVRLVYGRLDADHTPDVHREGVEVDELRPIFPGF